MSIERANALRCQANLCRNEMLKTRNQVERRNITDKYMRILVGAGFNKSDLLYEIYQITLEEK